MKIIVEVAGGMVSSVYFERTKGTRVRVFVVDLDSSENGEATVCEEKALEAVHP